MTARSLEQYADASILEALVEQNRQGRQCGVYSICSAHEEVLRASMEQALEDDSPLLIEATCNQVNQFGGYTGLRPDDFIAKVRDLANEVGFPLNRLLLGGDHLGPNPWRNEPAALAMEKAEELVKHYVRAGFCKLHLDASMACADDPTPLSVLTIATRAARLCAAAEETARELGRSEQQMPRYVIGTEVPVPGGAQSKHGESEALAVTEIADVSDTYESHRQVFLEQGLAAAFDRVVALVTQPGVEFDDQDVIDYQPLEAQALSNSILQFPGMVFEAHSTDYQTEEALTQLVRDHFAILKVGPGVTYAWREALFALSAIEDEILCANEQPSNVRRVLEQCMLDAPEHWSGYYQGDERAQRLARRYSYSDRIRYYWQQPEVCQAVECLVQNLRHNTPSEPLISQYLPLVYEARRTGMLTSSDPLDWLRYSVRHVIASYARACGFKSMRKIAA
ncbi:D-tagatose-bisphosphate aldolase, class II, non-catalytic subunit [Pseudomonas putida]|uniref:D-tagatose-bisphosphate aldolase, class II, non-catalytic subunit n=1 Tax=Pseudomonas putida TaxID=303 RepID=UPI0018D62D3F|nr:D-tagatose-bisphosphate aldolase, class II, non-catalytic subunit [Pseudomonas putida]MBH3470566.1 D-tagatose-bisphosphate aldolase, class II, non-catalytic subunit [Pseudomonas putida]